MRIEKRFADVTPLDSDASDDEAEGRHASTSTCKSRASFAAAASAAACAAAFAAFATFNAAGVVGGLGVTSIRCGSEPVGTVTGEAVGDAALVPAMPASDRDQAAYPASASTVNTTEHKSTESRFFCGAL